MSTKEAVFLMVKTIPKGKVATYGQIARLVDTGPRVVGKYLHQNKDPKTVPCHRVVHADGSLAPSYAFGGSNKQMQILIKEGVNFKNYKVNLKSSLWTSIT